MGRLAAQTVNLLSKRSPQANLLKGDMWWGDFVGTLARGDMGGIPDAYVIYSMAIKVQSRVGFDIDVF